MPENRRRNSPQADDGLLDETNLRLLAELQTDARLSLAELGRRVGLSSPAVAERVARLEREGVIRGYHAELDPRALGYVMTVHVRSVEHLEQVIDRCAAHGQTTTSIIQSAPVPRRGTDVELGSES